MSHTRSGWRAALEWAASMIESGYPVGSERPDPRALAETIRAGKEKAFTDDDLVNVGLGAAQDAYATRRRSRSEA